MPTFEAFTGQESWQNHSAKLSVFYVSPPNLQEVPLYTYVKNTPATNVSELGRTAIQARPGTRGDLGQWYRSNYLLPDRAILKLYGQRHPGQGMPDIKTMMYLRLREEAPHRHLAMRLSRGVAGAQQSAFVNGRFDIMLPGEMENYGIEIAPHFRRFFEPNAVSLFTDTILSPEIEARPAVRRVRVRNEQGQTVTFVRTRKPRQLRLE